MSDTPRALLEPVLPMADIQGIVVPGFLKPHHTLLGITASDDARAFKALVKELTDNVSTAADTLADRRQARAVAALSRSNSEKVAARALAGTAGPLVAIAFTFQ